MKKALLAILVLTLAMSASAQWVDKDIFPSDTLAGSHGCHGIAVDPDGKIWYQDYGYIPGDSVNVGDTLMTKVRAIHVFNPDGTPAAFSPILFATIGGVQDTLGGETTGAGWEGNSSRGMRMAADGNILCTMWAYVYKLDYKTGEGIFKLDLIDGDGDYNTGISNGVASETGGIFCGPVVPGNPILEFAEDGTLLGNALDATVGYSRSMEVSPDGNTIYWAGYTNHCIFMYTRPDEFSAFALSDSMALGFDTESCVWHPVTGDLWLSSGSQNDLPNRHPAATTNYQKAAWYAWNVQTMTITDSLIYGLPTPDTDFRPRGIGFSPDGNIAYVGVFGAYGEPAMKKFEKGETGVWEETAVIDGFTLAQNYPNPFNPTTQIDYSVGRPGKVKVAVYDIRGRRVALLVDDFKAVGNYIVDFDASGLASGTYIYRLEAGDRIITKKMTLTK